MLVVDAAQAHPCSTGIDLNTSAVGAIEVAQRRTDNEIGHAIAVDVASSRHRPTEVIARLASAELVQNLTRRTGMNRGASGVVALVIVERRADEKIVNT